MSCVEGLSDIRRTKLNDDFLPSIDIVCSVLRTEFENLWEDERSYGFLRNEEL